MLDIVCHDRYSEEISYRKLLLHLHNTEFTYIIPMDENRAEDGIALRHRFAFASGEDESCLDIGPCSVLEMMLALAIRCEEEIMLDPDIGDRTGQWFWGMINNLGLGGITDGRYDKAFVDDILERFLNRQYAYDGKGGLFRLRNSGFNMNNVEIWHQMCWYLNSIV